MVKIDRRLFSRYKTHLVAEVITSRCVLSVQIVEMSLYGLRIHSAYAVNPGTPVAVCIQLKEKILFRGDVMWALDHSGRYGINYSLGVSIESMEFSDQNATGLAERRDLMDQILYSLDEIAAVAHA